MDGKTRPDTQGFLLNSLLDNPLSIDEQDLRNLTQERFRSAYSVFEDRIQKQQLMCSIYDVYAEPGTRNRNCLGCNFDEMMDQILKFLYVCAENSSLFLAQQLFSNYVMLPNVVWERMSDIFEIIKLPQDYLSATSVHLSRHGDGRTSSNTLSILPG
jgi:hypothetical protein